MVLLYDYFKLSGGNDKSDINWSLILTLARLFIMTIFISDKSDVDHALTLAWLFLTSSS